MTLLVAVGAIVLTVAIVTGPLRSAPVSHRRSPHVVATIDHGRREYSAPSVATSERRSVATTATRVPSAAPASSDSSAATPTPQTPPAATPTTQPATSTKAASAPVTIPDPSTNVEPDPDFLVSGPCTGAAGDEACANPCVTSSAAFPTLDDDPACDDYILEAIDAARADEGLAPMVLPSNWTTLTTGQQLFVVANLERTARGLSPYLGINAALSAEAQRAADAGTDPGTAAGFPLGVDAQGYLAYGGAWASGFSVLAADYVWMYDDGWGGSSAATPNLECTSAAAAGCWAHRDELLGYDPRYNPGVGLDCSDCEFGVGYTTLGSSTSFADLVELPASTPPTMSFTWSEELAQSA